MADENSKGFDAANFLDNYREDIATPVRKTKKQAAQQPTVETPSPEVETPPPKVCQDTVSKTRSATDGKTSDSILSQEDSYIQEFLVERVPIGFSKSAWQVAVSEAHHDKIVKIIAILGERLTFGGFVDNILRKHFDENKDIIRNLISKNTDF